jgi:serine/threonine-protein kinase
MTSSLGHPNLVSVEFFDHRSADIAFYVMERLNGEPLSRVTNREGRVPPGRAVDIMAQALAGLDAAHSAGVIHRDLKPSNIFLVPTDAGAELVKVVDFGLAKLLTSDATKLTVTGSVVGTPHYLSPEQALGQPTDARADLFACGVVLYELLCGRRPFEGSDIAELLKKIARAETERIETFAPEIDPRLSDAVHRSLARRPEDRFASARDMRAALLEAVGRRDAPVRRRAKRRGLPMIAVLAIALSLGAFVAVAVAVGLTLFAGSTPEASAESFPAPAAVTPVLDEPPTRVEPVMEPTQEVVPMYDSATPAPPTTASPVAPPPLGIADCDEGARAACRCGIDMYRASLCQSAHELLADWRQTLAEHPERRGGVLEGCRTWNTEVQRLCPP